MARSVGPTGHVTAVDFDPLVVDFARADANEAGVDNVEFAKADVSSFDGGPFSFIHARYLLSHVSEPDRVFATLKALLAPGGTMAIEDIDMSGANRNCAGSVPGALYRSGAPRRGRR